MSFFNSKEDILEINLTSFGKYLLSRGDFKPVYYDFYDDDVLYDGNYAALTESQNNIQDRLINNTPQLKPQYNFSGLEHYGINGSLKKQEEQCISEKYYALVGALGNATAGDMYYPSFSLSLLNGEIEGTIDVLTSSLRPNLKIPQITLKNNQYLIKQVDNINNLESGYKVIFEDFDNNQFVIYKDSTNLLEIIEENTSDELENFELEVFKIEANGKEIPLKFIKKPTYIKNGILLDTPLDADASNIIKHIKDDNVEWYFNIKTDSEIDKTKLPQSTNDIYDTNVNENDKPVGEDC